MSAVAAEGSGRFPPQLMYAAAVMYYLQDATQAEIATRLDTSRATVSRLLSQARRQGIVTIDVVPPAEQFSGELAARAADALGLAHVHLFNAATAEVIGPAMAPALSEALADADLHAGDVVVVASGRMLYAASRTELPPLPGVHVVPAVGGQLEPEPWYQTNEITREFAARVGGHPAFLYAPALPGPELHASLLADPAIEGVTAMWERARCAVTGVGAPPSVRRSLPHFVPADTPALVEAVGDVCSRFYDRDGAPVGFPGSERLIATSLERLRQIPVTIAVAVGAEKVGGIVAGARAGYFNRLVTDAKTAALLVEAARR